LAQAAITHYQIIKRSMLENTPSIQKQKNIIKLAKTLKQEQQILKQITEKN
jgi:hypothetical protein